MAKFLYSELPLSNDSILFDFSNICVYCKVNFGKNKGNKVICLKCFNNLSEKEKKLTNYLGKRYKIMNSKQFKFLKIKCKMYKKLYNEKKLNINYIGEKLFLLVFLLSTNRYFDDENNLFEKKIKINEIKYLLSLKQAEELLIILNSEVFGNQFHVISHVIARWLIEPWNQSDWFHKSSLCYYGNFGEKIYNKFDNYYNRLHGVYLSNISKYLIK